METLSADGDIAELCVGYDNVREGDVAFFLGCVGIAKEPVLALNQSNLIVHESALPKGRGFSPLTWQILENHNVIPLCLLFAAETADAGAVVYREQLNFEGHELNSELKSAQGEKTVELCLQFMRSSSFPRGEPQQGEATWYKRRGPEDSRLDPNKSITEQFNLLRVVDNDRYPAFFELNGQRYILKIEKAD